MSTRPPTLARHQRTGSKPRCHQLTDGPAEGVSRRLSVLMGSRGVVMASDQWMPRGFQHIEEAQLHKADGLITDSSYRHSLLNWWLPHGDYRATTPNWDIASTGRIDGRRGLLLVEAKAHHDELKVDDHCGARNRQHYNDIARAIGEASESLNDICRGWRLSHETHYQLCNRLAWSWKLATLGIPVVLVYLGFLNANEMHRPFPDGPAWEAAVRGYAAGVMPDGLGETNCRSGMWQCIRSFIHAGWILISPAPHQPANNSDTEYCTRDRDSG